MSNIVSPKAPRPTHHVKLTDRLGRELGLIIVDANGKAVSDFAALPFDRTSFKTTTGVISYNSFDYPYSPIAQQDWTGGRGQLNFEDDVTKYLDNYRTRPGVPGRVFLGPQEQYGKGFRSVISSKRMSVDFVKLLDKYRILTSVFVANATMTAAQVWVEIKYIGEPGDLKVKIAAGSNPGSYTETTVTTTKLHEDGISEYVSSPLALSITSGSTYTISVEAAATDGALNHWEIGTRTETDTIGVTQTTYYYSESTYSAAPFSLYYRILTADYNSSVIPFTYKEQLYCVVSTTQTANPIIYMNGDRGVADSNSGQLTKLIDASKSWTVNGYAGCVALIIDGLGVQENIPYRTIVSNTSTALTVSPAWEVAHDTTTMYVILGSENWTSLGNRGLTDYVTDVLVSSKDVVYFAQGDLVNIQRMRAQVSSGAWEELGSSGNTDADGTNKATFLVEAPVREKILSFSNKSVQYNTASPANWGTNLSFSGATAIGSPYRKFTGKIVYTDVDGGEAVWVGKLDRPYIIPATGSPYPLPFSEMEYLRSEKNFKTSIRHDYYLYFTLGNGIQRWYNDQLVDVGPNLGDGITPDRQGYISAMLSFPGKIFAATDAGDDGYSVLYDLGWHERYRTPKGQRIKAIMYQAIPGNNIDKFWVWQGNDVAWLPMPSNTTYEIEEEGYFYHHEGYVELSRMHAGLRDIKKLARSIKIASELLSDTQRVKLQYRVDNETTWKDIDSDFTVSPMESQAMNGKHGISGTRIMLRLMLTTTDRTKSPVAIAVILEAVSRIAQRNMYSFTTLLMDNAKDMNGDQEEGVLTADKKLELLKKWSGDEADSILDMESISNVFHDKRVFLEPVGVKSLRHDVSTNDGSIRSGYIVNITLRDA